MNVRFITGACTLGIVLVAMSARGLCALFLGDDAETLIRALCVDYPQAQPFDDEPQAIQLLAMVQQLISAPHKPCNWPLDLQGTTFQRQVWQVLRTIPVGETWSYSQLAQAIAAPHAVRAVARACAANKLAIVIPCHRVIGINGGLSGYRWGVSRKAYLLQQEQQTLP